MKRLLTKKTGSLFISILKMGKKFGKRNVKSCGTLNPENIHIKPVDRQSAYHILLNECSENKMEHTCKRRKCIRVLLLSVTILFFTTVHDYKFSARALQVCKKIYFTPSCKKVYFTHSGKQYRFSSPLYSFEDLSTNFLFTYQEQGLNGNFRSTNLVNNFSSLMLVKYHKFGTIRCIRVPLFAPLLN